MRCRWYVITRVLVICIYTTASLAITPVQELSGMPWYYGQYALPAESHIAADLGWQCVDVEPPAPTGPPVTAAVLTRTVRADD